MSDAQILAFARQCGGKISIEMVLSELADIPAPVVIVARPRGGASREHTSHSRDFATVGWYGETYYFSRKQRLVVAHLWEAMRADCRCVGREALLNAADSECVELRDLFRRCPAWGVLIVPGVEIGGPVGTYALADPPDPIPPNSE